MQRQPGGVYGLNSAGNLAVKLTQGGVPRERPLAQLGIFESEQQLAIGTAILKCGRTLGDAALEGTAKLALERRIGKRGDKAFHRRQLFVQIQERVSLVHEQQCQAVRLRTGHKHEELLRRDHFAGLRFLGGESLEFEAALRCRCIHRRFGSEIFRQDHFDCASALAQPHYPMIRVRSNGADLVQVFALESLRLVGRNLLSGRGHQPDTTGALDLELFHCLEADLAVR